MNEPRKTASFLDNIRSGEPDLLEPSFAEHSHRVLTIKMVIVGIASLCILIMIAWPLTNMGKRSFKVNLASQNGEAATQDKPRMDKPRLHGVDKNKQPYNLTGDYAIQQNPNTMTIYNIEGDIFLKENGWIALKAKTGNYQVKNKQIYLEGDVSVFTDSGYEIITEVLESDLEKGETRSNHKVNVQGPLCTIDSNGLIINNQNDVIIFTDGVHVKAYPKSKS